ncbi:MAG: hypothetical protein OFPII_39800 [Osedax symbiont Rs1]|nr:MAG: hypothetical protein OFPII_39800 [Osedax symbiont Rs1]
MNKDILMAGDLQRVITLQANTELIRPLKLSADQSTSEQIKRI